jgi:XRE family transcriptional regulator, aerobic/anaerobic benzoate catabolism transcriptional regulator
MSNERGAKLRRSELPAEDSAYLRLLGERVRDMRARRGMTRKILARDSGVSERYLAQLEAGQGNFSVILLRQVAQAMGLPMEDLVRDGPDQPPELTLLSQYLGRLSPAKLARARQLLQGEFEAAGKRERQHRIALIGLRGGGKSTLGAMLALRLGVPFVELASEIERVAGVTLSEVFSLYGQIAYRRYERRALESVVEANEGFVMAPGGSIVSEPATFDLLLTHCFTVWLRASPEEHMARVVAQGDSRPMRDNEEAMEDLKRILAGREAMYSKADVVVDTTGRSAEQSVEDILSLLPA